jgi:hypothetical protein
MNLLMSEMLPVDAGLDRSFLGTEDLASYVAMLPIEREIVECHEDRSYGGVLAWLEPRLSALRDVFTSDQ